MSKSKTAIYEMRRDGWRDYFELHVSPNAHAMRMHAEATYRKIMHPLPEGWASTIGVVLPLYRTSGGVGDGLFAYCFLNEQDLGAGVVSHECLHVAFAHERFVLQFGMDYGDGMGDHTMVDEERLAYFLTATVKGVYNTLYDNGHIKESAR